MSSNTEEMRKEILESVSTKQQENEKKIDEMKETLEQMRMMMQQMMLIDESSMKRRSESDEDRPAVRRSLNLNHIPELTTPVTAAKQTLSFSPLATTPLSHHQYQHHQPQQQAAALELPISTSMSDTARAALQKGMAKPPTFEGGINDNILTWWRQVKNFAMTFEPEVQARLIKSYLKGPAALWYDAKERELGRELTVEELASGLSQEYGSETTSQAALQKLETLTMANEKCRTLQEYHCEFNKYYNLLNSRDQAHAVRCYIKGIAPKYLKYVVFSDTNFNSLAEAKAAVTLAAAKHDQLEIAYSNYQQQKGRSSNAPSHRSSNMGNRRQGNSNHNSRNHYNNNHNNNDQHDKRGESNNPYRVLLSSVSDISLHSDDDGENGEGEGERKEGQLAAVASSPPGNSSHPNNQGRLRLTQDQMQMLRREYRCYNCHEYGHRAAECKNSTASKPPMSLKGAAPSRRA
jgi:hypothetical protein